jgi:hypothetical protein
VIARRGLALDLHSGDTFMHIADPDPEEVP